MITWGDPANGGDSSAVQETFSIFWFLFLWGWLVGFVPLVGGLVTISCLASEAIAGRLPLFPDSAARVEEQLRDIIQVAGAGHLR